MREIKPEDVLSEMQQRVTAIVEFFQTGASRKSAIEKCANFLGISQSQAKCLVYGQSNRIAAHVADQIRLRSDLILNEIKSAKESYVEKRSEIIGRLTELQPVNNDNIAE